MMHFEFGRDGLACASVTYPLPYPDLRGTPIPALLKCTALASPARSAGAQQHPLWIETLTLKTLCSKK